MSLMVGVNSVLKKSHQQKHSLSKEVQICNVFCHFGSTDHILCLRLEKKLFLNFSYLNGVRKLFSSCWKKNFANLNQLIFFDFFFWSSAAEHEQCVVMHKCIPICFMVCLAGLEQEGRNFQFKYWCKWIFFVVVQAESYKLLKISMYMVCFKFVFKRRHS